MLFSISLESRLCLTLSRVCYSSTTRRHASHDCFNVVSRDGDLSRTELQRQSDLATVDRSHYSIRWDNSRGLSVLEGLEEHKARLERLETKMESQGDDIHTQAAEIQTQAAEIATLKVEVVGLKLSSTFYLQVRSHFSSVFLRDKMQKLSRADAKLIKNGNISAHEGDSLVDVTMFRKDVRFDDKTFRLLYGLE